MSITLAAGSIETLSIGGVITETTSISTTMDISVNPINLNVLYKKGIGIGANFTRGGHTRDINLSINTVTGQWQADTGPSGTLGSAALTNLNTGLNNFRDRMETFAINQGIIAGTQVPN